MPLMRHGDYIARVVFDESIEAFFGEVIDTSDVITFYGRSVEELHREMAQSIEVHREACREGGLSPAAPTADGSTSACRRTSTLVLRPLRPPPA